MRFAVLASHEGTTLQAVLDGCSDGTLPGEVVLVLSNNSNSGALRRAQAASVPTMHISGKTHPDPADCDAAMLAALEEARVDWLLLLGYMKKLGPQILSKYAGRIINTHPALLPKYGGQGFYGRKVHEAVIAAGDSESGATVHLVDAEYDTGPLLSQVRVPLVPGETADSLEAKVKTAEQKLLIHTLAELAQPQASNY